MKRNATAVWQGTGKEGNGNLTTQSNVLNKTPYTYKMRFEDAPGTNPEELVAAAHAGCFTMKMAFATVAAGFTADKLETTCQITLEGGAITSSQLTLTASIPGMSQEKFAEVADDAKKNCPISKLLNTNITLDAKLV